jgi:putative acetyltransferase
MLTVEQEISRQADVQRLLEQSDAYSAALYPSEGRHPVDTAFLARPEVRLFVARQDGQAVGCGALVVGAERRGEIKRMIVHAAARGQGVGGAILQAIETAAKQQDIEIIRLETGPHSLEALALYQRHGYRPRGAFGGYGESPHSVFMEKRL